MPYVSPERQAVEEATRALDEAETAASEARQQRDLALVRARRANCPVAGIIEAAKISRQSYYKITDRYM